MIVVWLFLTMPGVCLQFVIVVFPDHTHLTIFGIYLRINCRLKKACVYFFQLAKDVHQLALSLKTFLCLFLSQFRKLNTFFCIDHVSKIILISEPTLRLPCKLCG